MACRLSAASDPARLWFINSVQTLQSLTVLHIRATKRACSWNRLCIILFVHMHCIPFYLTPYGNQPLRQKCRQGLVKQASRFRDALKASNNLSCAGCQPQCPHTGGDASTSLVNTAFCINVHLSAIRLKRVHLFTWVRWVVWIARSIFKKKSNDRKKNDYNRAWKKKSKCWVNFVLSQCGRQGRQVLTVGHSIQRISCTSYYN